ncbi:MAG: PAS domain-containing sensor histidine kinase [Patescibacteria group bacterium]|nr:PAS domain-containing sensor histidine kinase [Patescibacteria group bacterium]
MPWTTIRLWILMLGWPTLALGSIYILYKSFDFLRRIRQASLGKFVLVTNTGIIVSMWCLGLVATFFLLQDAIGGVTVVLPIFIIWAVVMVTLLFMANKWGNEAVEINTKIQRTKDELEKSVRQRTKELQLALANNVALLESIGDGLIAADTKLKIMMVNPAAQKMLGWKIDDLRGQIMTAETPRIEDERGEEVDVKSLPANMALLTGKKVKMDAASKDTYYYVRKDGTRFPVAITATPITIKDQTKGIIMLFRDISTEKELDKAKSEFISLASHQLRTPPTAIKWNAELLLEDKSGKMSKAQTEMVEEVKEISEKMIETVSSLLNVSRIELGTFIVDPKPVDYREVAAEALKELKPQINIKKLQVLEKFDKDIPMIPADPGLAKIVIENLLTNAVKYTPEEGQVKIEIKNQPKTKSILISVKDTGCGIPKKDQEKIFKKMFRAENVKSKIDGTGFGLYLLKSVVEMAGGKVWFESQENKGTTFFVELPYSGMKKKEGTSRLGQ